MLPFIREQIVREAAGLNIHLEVLTPEQGRALRESLARRFGDGRVDEIHWNHLADHAAVQHPDSWKWIEEFLQDEPVYLFSNSSDEEAVFKLESGLHVFPLLAECSGFEFYVVNMRQEYVLCQNHHDYLIGTGTAKSWVNSLKPRHEQWAISLKAKDPQGN